MPYPQLVDFKALTLLWCNAYVHHTHQVGLMTWFSAQTRVLWVGATYILTTIETTHENDFKPLH